MTRLRRQLGLAAATLASVSLLAIFLLNPELRRDPARPSEARALTKWIAEHPADWLAASVMTDQSLDSSLALPQRIAVWHNSYALARYLAPLRTNPTAAFVRAGLFHWYELGPADREAVLKTAAPLLADQTTFASMHRSLWELTRDLGYLRRVAPKSVFALTLLRDLAVASGDFSEYRTLRAALRDARMAEFRAKRPTATVAELIAIVPPWITLDDAPLIRAVLEEIERRPFDVASMGGRLEDITLFAIRHDIKPLTALAPLVEIQGKLTNPTRARLAIALGERGAATRIELLTGIITTREWIPYHLERATFEEKHGETAVATTYRTRATVADGPKDDVWTNTCGASDLCSSVYRTHEGPLQFHVEVAQSDEIPPYVEIYVDDALVAEGEVHDARQFTVNVTAAPGKHLTEVRLVNRFTRNGTQRRARLS